MGSRTGKLLPIFSLLGHILGWMKRVFSPSSPPELNTCGSVFNSVFNLAAGCSCAPNRGHFTGLLFMSVFNSKSCPQTKYGRGDFAVLCLGELWFPLCLLWSQEDFGNQL